MDEFDESLELEPENSRGSKAGIIAIWIGIIGIVVGVTGIFLANQAQTKLRSLEAQIAATPDQTPELKASLDELEDRLVKLGSEFVKLGRQDRQIQENTQSAFDTVTRDIRTNRDGINQLTEKLGEVVVRLENSKVIRTPVAVKEPTVSDGDEEGLATVEEQGIHIIESGDTLSKVAKAYGVSLGKLQEANPTINPRALQIGQRIVIPAP